jgi:hypothetical protein
MAMFKTDHRAAVEQKPYSLIRECCQIIQTLKAKFVPENIRIW